MNNQELISVIVPVYNTAPWLRRCLDSICAQSYRNLEILCVNDGSTDNSAEILAEYAAKDARIRIITQQNAGVSAARNNATAKARGEWIMYVDADDYLSPDIAAECIRLITPEVDVVAFSVEMRWQDGRTREMHETCYFNLYTTTEQVSCTPATAVRVSRTVWGKLWRHSVIAKHDVHSPVGLRHEDDAFYYFFMRHCRGIAFCPMVGYYYFQQPNSFMHAGRSALETALLYAKVIRYVLDYVQQLGESPHHCPWCQMMLTLIYKDRYHNVSTADRDTLQEAFHTITAEYGFLPALQSEYRFRRMKPVRGWRRLFLSRYLNTELWRFLGVPVWQVDYPDGREAQHHFVLLYFIKQKLGTRN